MLAVSLKALGYEDRDPPANWDPAVTGCAWMGAKPGDVSAVPSLGNGPDMAALPPGLDPALLAALRKAQRR